MQAATSGLFVVIRRATADEAISALERYGWTVIKTSFSDEDIKMLEEALQPSRVVGGEEATGCAV